MYTTNSPNNIRLEKNKTIKNIKRKKTYRAPTKIKATIRRFRQDHKKMNQHCKTEVSTHNLGSHPKGINKHVRTAINACK